VTKQEHNQHSAVRIELAQRMAHELSQRFDVRGSMLVGSVAQGLADESSDIDMTLYYDSMPEQADLLALREEVGGSERVLLLGSCAEEGMVESYWLEGIRIDFAHCTLGRLERDLDSVLLQGQHDSPYQKVCSGLLHGMVLLGEELCENLRTRVSIYPDGLRENMVRENLVFHPRWVLDRMSHTRGDLFYLREKLVEASRRILLALCGVNRIYHWGDFKHLQWITAQMQHAPGGLEQRIMALLTDEPTAALASLDQLILATFDIVELELPQLDIPARRSKYLREFGA
jgi:predicted nucleotidyltransferase